jgi:hypothetical protein
MIVVNDDWLKTLHGRGRCEFCGELANLVPHHLFCRGFGGGTRMDVPCFVMRLGSLGCHRRFHDGKIERKMLLAKVAIRERCLPDELDHAFRIAVRLPKSPWDIAVNHELSDAGANVRRMVWAAVAAHRKMMGAT